MKLLLIGLAVALVVVFVFIFYSKVTNKGPIAYHRHPEDIRRGWGDPIDIVTTGGIPITKVNEATSHYLKPYADFDTDFCLKAHKFLAEE